MASYGYGVVKPYNSLYMELLVLKEEATHETFDQTHNLLVGFTFPAKCKC